MNLVERIRESEHEDLAYSLTELLTNFHHQKDLKNPVWELPIYQRILNYVQRSEKLLFILPAFPAKSSNREKTLGILPDMGEFLALNRLESLAIEMEALYPAGVEILICSDGRVFNDLVLVSDSDLRQYQEAIKQMIQEHQFLHLNTFSLDECFDTSNYAEMRERFMNIFGESFESIKLKVENSESERQLFNGIHRFITEDRLALIKDKSKNQISKESKVVTLNVMRRSKAWDKLLNAFFPEALRLSIHPYPITHAKFSFQLVNSDSHWATPWHNVVLKDEKGFRLVKHKEAKEVGSLKKHLGIYEYYEA